MTRRTRTARTAAAGLVVAGLLTLLGACGGRTDGGTPIPSGNEGEATTSTTVVGG
ncbi:MAG: hypothetical protein KDB04_08860 [Acidimicrobiales bacterium]|nr:hypothetical protein [Acidimicrobiales bacterium]HRW36685.1 hypothetical protein [Aquihabitans sp.]